MWDQLKRFLKINNQVRPGAGIITQSTRAVTNAQRLEMWRAKYAAQKTMGNTKHE